MLSYQELLQLPYQEFLTEVLRDAPKRCTWRAISSWLEKNYTSEQISEMYLKLYKQLVEFTPDNMEEDPSADPLRDKMDIFWYAGDPKLHDRVIHKFLEENNML